MINQPTKTRTHSQKQLPRSRSYINIETKRGNQTDWNISRPTSMTKKQVLPSETEFFKQRGWPHSLKTKKTEPNCPLPVRKSKQSKTKLLSARDSAKRGFPRITTSPEDIFVGWLQTAPKKKNFIKGFRRHMIKKSRHYIFLVPGVTGRSSPEVSNVTSGVPFLVRSLQ